MYLSVASAGNRFQVGKEVAFGDLDGDGGQELAASSPWWGAGRIDLFPGGLAADFGW
jgi:hypothetical protein